MQFFFNKKYTISNCKIKLLKTILPIRDYKTMSHYLLLTKIIPESARALTEI